MIVICAGMYRAGSTWQYQVAFDLLQRSGRPCVKAGFLEGANLVNFLERGPDPDTWYVLKCHDADPRFSALVAAGRGVGLYCYRDLRDVVYSMAHKVCGGFWDAVRDHGIVEKCLTNDAFWTAVPGVLSQRYEDRVAEDRTHIGEIARHLGVTVSESAVTEISDSYSLQQNRNRTESLEVSLRASGVNLDDRANAFCHDSDTLLHWNHIRTGAVGTWRETATQEELAVLAEKCGAWLIAKGYERDLSWAQWGARTAA